MILDPGRWIAAVPTVAFAPGPHEWPARFDRAGMGRGRAHDPAAARLRRMLGRVPPVMLALALGAIVFAAVHGAIIALRSSGQAIREELAAAAVAVGAMPENTPAGKIVKTVGWYFRDRTVAIDTTGFPAVVAVTIEDVNRKTCREAATAARRIARLVVVELVGYRTAASCGERNAMTWRIMP